ncbi:hydroxyacid dehydrogenase [Brachybacterium timonense]|uniref:hydroxyacid dehydrogenase n=1 Tax=Brachybacterium timonense TaxID=2050896 RepID=UPI000D0B9125|nr:hydroxyacid dehydrogenase [Brachybacterium timonense]
MTRPHALLAMSPTLPAQLFTPELRDRLTAVLDLDATSVVQDWSALADEELARTAVIVTGWGAPPLTGDVLRRMPALRAVVHTAGSVRGLIPAEAITDRDLLVTSAAGENAVPVAEYTLAQIILARKSARRREERLRTSRGQDRSWDPARDGNHGATIGLIGASRIGRRVAELLRPLDLGVLISDPYASAEDIEALGAQKVELPELFDRCDVISVHAPDLPSTRGLVSADLLARMRDGATLINTARPALVDHDALRAEVLAGRLDAVLDVNENLGPDDPLWDAPNVILTPHIAGSLGNELHRMATAAVVEAERWVQGLPPLAPVDPATFHITA